MDHLDLVLQDSKKRLYLQRKFRLEQFKGLLAPDAVMSEAVRLLREAQGDLDESALADALSVYQAYADTRVRSSSL